MRKVKRKYSIPIFPIIVSMILSNLILYIFIDKRWFFHIITIPLILVLMNCVYLFINNKYSTFISKKQVEKLKSEFISYYMSGEYIIKDKLLGFELNQETFSKYIDVDFISNIIFENKIEYKGRNYIMFKFKYDYLNDAVDIRQYRCNRTFLISKKA